jgi:HK97 family phage major capsid protein
MSTPSLIRFHPLTGLPIVPVGHRRDGRPIWPILGGDPTTDPGLTLYSLEDLAGKTPEELRQIVEKVDERIRGLHQTPTGELRDLSDDEGKGLDLLLTVRDKAMGKIEEHRRITEVLRNRPSAVQPGFTIGLGPTDDPYASVRAMSIPEARDRALRILDSKQHSAFMTDAQKTEVDKQVRKHTDIARRVIVTENEDYRSAWVKLMTNPRPFLSLEEQRAVQAWEEYRAMSEGTTTAGGFGIPVFIDPSIILTAQESDNPFLTLATVSDITTNAWKGVSSAGVTWSFDAEAVEVSDDSPTQAQPTVTVFMARGFIPYSIEVGEDYPAFASEMATLLSSGYDELLVDKFTRGSGTGEPKGVVTALDATSASEVLLTTAAQFGAVDVHKVWNAVPQKFRRRASWLMPVDNNSLIAQMGTALGANYTVDLTEAGVERIRARQVYETPYITGFTATTAHQNVLVVGDFKTGYRIARRGGMSVELVPHLFSTTTNLPSGQRGWFAYARIGGDVVAAPALRLLNQT